MERREKQKQFEEKQKQKFTTPIEYNENREITIYTCGFSKRDSQNTEQNFDVSNIDCKNIPEIDLKEVTGMDQTLKDKLKSLPRFIGSMRKIIEKVEKNDNSCITINCKNGYHRSVAMANLIKDQYYNKAKVIHLELGKNY